MVIGANGVLGTAILQQLGKDTAIAATRAGRLPLPGFDHVQLGPDGVSPSVDLTRCRAVINAAGVVRGDRATIEAANIQLPMAIATAAKAAGVAKFVQVSSFSVYGAVELIGAETPEFPTSAYGKSKAHGDAALQALADDRFAVESLRLPFMFSSSKAGLLGPLLSAVDKFGVLPDVAGRPVARSMMTYSDAAATLVDCARDSKTGISLAADPQLFDYHLFKAVLEQAAGRRFSIISVPGKLADLIAWTLPPVGRRLFRSSKLDERCNRAGNLPLGLEHSLRDLAGNFFSQRK
ncbi:MAG TPA: NAD-dependent epimerase/dehydratase family protein [Sphingorhabdus sp.]|nr:NAD-dependent epimerase/dehydratase family protein [Sphingorhabdus sp.]